MKDIFPILCLLAFMLLTPKVGRIFGSLLWLLERADWLLNRNSKGHLANVPWQKTELPHERAQSIEARKWD